MKRWREAIKLMPKSTIIQLLILLILLLPLIATIGQYWSSRFFSKTVPTEILFWPGIRWSYSIQTPVWFITTIFGLTYLLGIVFLLKRKTLGTVGVWGILVLLFAKLIAAPINYLMSWHELQSIPNMSLVGKVNLLILASWHNPLWEEIVFRGLPLVVLFCFIKKYKVSDKAKLVYIMVPSIVCSIYHIPNHGMSRIIDAFIISAMMAWITLKYTFVAAVVLHYVYDAIIVVNLSNMRNIPYQEIKWLADNGWLLRTSFSVLVIGFMVAIPVVAILNYRSLGQRDNSNTGLCEM